MKRLFIATLLTAVLLPNLVDAQRWKRYRRQFVAGAGVTNFLGELGGSNQVGRDFIYDLDFVSTRPSLMVGYRYQVNTFFFARSNIQWGILKGDDQNTEEISRRGRNLSFRSGFFEANLMGEFYLIQNARGNLYNLRGVRGRSGLQMDVYVFGGLGFMYFNPKAEIGGKYVALQPLGTEGQGLPGQEDKYRRTTFTVPYGVGIGKSIDRYWSVNVEFTMRATFTDYIDDVSTTYYGSVGGNVSSGDQLARDQIAQGISESQASQAGSLSDRNIYGELDHLPDDVNLAGQPRGDASDNDAFMTGMISISRKIVKRRRSRPKF